MNYATIKPYDVANGPGIRVSLFVSGCTHGCKDCFNEEAWDFSYGSLFTSEVEAKILEQLSFDYIAGLSLLGGEPLESVNQVGLLPLLKQVRAQFPEKTIWCYSGYTWEYIRDFMIPNSVITKELVSCMDVLVDGKFVAAQKNLTLRFRGSENQRILDVKKSLATGKGVDYDFRSILE